MNTPIGPTIVMLHETNDHFFAFYYTVFLSSTSPRAPYNVSFTHRPQQPRDYLENYELIYIYILKYYILSLT